MIAELWERHAGGILPVLRRQPREVFIHDGAAYRIKLVWLRRSLGLEYTTPRTPADVRRAREADLARSREAARRKLAGEWPVKVGDQIPRWAIGYLVMFEEVRDSEFTVWKRAVGDERYARNDDGTLDRSQEYDWIAWLAGEWCGGWCTNQGLLDNAPLTVVKVKPMQPGSATS